MSDPNKKPLPLLKRAEIGLASQGRAAGLVANLTPEQLERIAATVTDAGFATPATVDVVRTVYREYLDEYKATDADFDQEA